MVLLIVAGSIKPLSGAPSSSTTPLVAVSTNPPGGLSPAETPQILLLTFDDSMTEASYEIARQVLTNRMNPNGNPVKMTFFVSLEGLVNYEHIRRLYEAGNEIAIHSMTQGTSTNTTLSRWRAEIVGCRKALSELAAIPLEDLAGFRSPQLDFNNASFQILAERGLLYDASVLEAPGLLSPHGASYIWPYTLDSGMLQSCVTGSQPTQAFPGIFEVPLWDQLSNGIPIVAMDPPDTYTSNQVVELWQTNFLMHYEGNRAPFMLALHAAYTNQWLSDPAHPWRVQALNSFLSWAQTRSNVWMITVRDLVRFMSDPCGIAQAPTSQPFITQTRMFLPDDEVYTVYYPDGVLTACGTPPLDYPSLSNVYYQATPMPGGALSLEVTTNGGNNLEVTMVVSNGANDESLDWAATFKVPTNSPLLDFYQCDAATVTNGAWFEITFHPAWYNRYISPGEALANVSFILSGTEAQLSIDGLTLYDFRPGQPVISGFNSAPGGQCLLDWDDSALGYQIECSTTLVAAASWFPLTNLFAHTHWTGVVSYLPSAFFKVTATP